MREKQLVLKSLSRWHIENKICRTKTTTTNTEREAQTFMTCFHCFEDKKSDNTSWNSSPPKVDNQDMSWSKSAAGLDTYKSSLDLSDPRGATFHTSAIPILGQTFLLRVDIFFTEVNSCDYHSICVELCFPNYPSPILLLCSLPQDQSLILQGSRWKWNQLWYQKLILIICLILYDHV